MRTELQKLRDEAEQRCVRAELAGDRDSSNAWERIAVEIDDCQRKIRYDMRIIEERRGLFEAATAAAAANAPASTPPEQP